MSDTVQINGNNLRVIINHSRLSVLEVAKRLKMTNARVYKLIKTPVINITTDELDKITRTLTVALEHLTKDHLQIKELEDYKAEIRNKVAENDLVIRSGSNRVKK